METKIAAPIAARTPEQAHQQASAAQADGFNAEERHPDMGDDAWACDVQQDFSLAGLDAAVITIAVWIGFAVAWLS